MLSEVLSLFALAAASTLVANPDTGRTPMNTPVTTNVLANDTSSAAPLDRGSVTIVTPSPNGTAAVNANGTVTFTPAGGSIRVSIKNEYVAKLNFGPLGKGSRDGTDTAEGVLQRQGDKYVGVVDAAVDSNQTLTGMIGRCGPARYQDSQKLKVIGHPADGFNPYSQTVNAATMTGQASNEYLALEFTPETMTSQQTGPRLPQQMLPDLVISCHTLIDTLSGIAFLPLNDSRWTMEGGGYIVRLPASGTIRYTDGTVPAAGGAKLGPFDAEKSVWTIEVERLP